MGTSTPDEPQDELRHRTPTDPDAPMPVIGPSGIEPGQAVARRPEHTPARRDDAAALAARLPPPRSTYVAIFGDSKRTGQFVPAESSTAVSVFGDVKIDLREAVVPQDRITVNAYSMFGDVTVIIPPGFIVDAGGFQVFGDLNQHIRPIEAPSPTDRTVILNGYCMFGDVTVRTLDIGEKAPTFWDRFRRS
ncbi:MAG: LiaF-related protein [Mobilicoccus sp.]|nr:LiaF-related protein [Mobilicoccus sp.]